MDVCSRAVRRHTLPGTQRRTCGVRMSRSSSLTCGSQTARTWIQSIASADGLVTSTIHDNQPAEAGDRHWVGQTIAVFHRSCHWSVASLAAWVDSPTARQTDWTFDVKTETINTLFPVVNFLKNVLLQKSSCFQMSHLRHLTFHKVV